MESLCSLFLLLVLSSLSNCRTGEHSGPDDISRPPTPVWPQEFTISFDIYVKVYGENWNSTGALYYEWETKTFRADYIHWCFPIAESHKYSCTFLATGGNMYFVNHTANNWKEYDCCLFQKGLAAVPPDWMKIGIFNGTDTIEGVPVDVWWFPGTNDPSQHCYSYWNAKDESYTPVRFFGITPIGPTILDYRVFLPGRIPSNIPLDLPNSNCKKECEPPLLKLWRETPSSVRWPDWPSCE